MPHISWEVGDFFMFEAQKEEHLSYGAVVSGDGACVVVDVTGKRTGRYIIRRCGAVPEDAVPIPSVDTGRISMNFEIKMALLGAVVAVGGALDRVRVC